MFRKKKSNKADSMLPATEENQSQGTYLIFSSAHINKAKSLFSF